jgi:ketosteroid isomerase-like protein
MMWRMASLVVAVLLTRGVPASADSPSPEDVHAALADLVAAERSFSALSVEQGMKTAFLTYLAEDGMVFRPLPVNGRKVWEARGPVPGTLIWEPSFAEVAGSGDLGYTTGPWDYRPPADSTGTVAEDRIAHGHFISVWRREPGAGWRVAVDLGISHGRPARGVGSGDFGVGPTHSGSVPRAGADPRGLDAELARATARRGIARGLANRAAADIRLNRDGVEPILGRAAARASLDTIGGRWAIHPAGSGASQAGDLAYSFGTIERFTKRSAAAADTSVYLHVWRREPDGRWKLALAVLNPLR